jgi:hypothetical protein
VFTAGGERVKQNKLVSGKNNGREMEVLPSGKRN